VRSAIGESQSRASDQIGDDSRNENLAWLAMRHDSGRRMHCDPADVPAPQFDFARVDSGTRLQADLLCRRPERQGASDSAPRAVERGKNAVAGALDHRAAMLLDELSSQLIVIVEQPPPTLIAHFHGTTR
jgi:hypothetical protein